MCHLKCQETQKFALSSNTLTLFRRRKGEILPELSRRCANRPELKLFANKPFIGMPSLHLFQDVEYGNYVFALVPI